MQDHGIVKPLNITGLKNHGEFHIVADCDLPDEIDGGLL
jgi:hypothetical protein